MIKQNYNVKLSIGGDGPLYQDLTNLSNDLIEAIGPDLDRIFTMGVKISKYLFGTGKGKNKQSAEQNAAAEAIKNWEDLYSKYFK